MAQNKTMDVSKETGTKLTCNGKLAFFLHYFWTKMSVKYVPNLFTFEYTATRQKYKPKIQQNALKR